MLRSIQKYKNTFLGTLMVVFVGVSMLGFGINMFQKKSNQPYAIKIDDTEISLDRFHNEKRNLENQYRQILGKNYDSMAKSLGIKINENVSNNLISEVLVSKLTKDLGIVVGENEIRSSLLRFFRGAFSPENYQSYLSSIGQTAPEFEAKLAVDNARQQLETLFEDISLPLAEEVRAQIVREGSTYNIDLLTLEPKDFLSKAKEPTEEAINNYFNSNSSDYELSGKVNYDYVKLSVETFPDLVEISPEEIETYYVENEDKYKNQDEIKARHIQAQFPKDSTPEKKEEVKKRAEQILDRIKAGEDFGKVAESFSDDYATKSKGGDLGWIKRGKLSPELEEKIFALKNAGEAVLIPVSYGYHIVKVESYKAASSKPLELVKDEIREKLKKENAPLFLSAKSQELFNAWEKSGLSLKDFALEKKLPLSSTNVLLPIEQDPEPTLKGLTSRVFDDRDIKKQFVELSDTSLLVSVLESKEAELPPIASVKSDISMKLKTDEANKLAKESAENVIEEIKSNPAKTLKQLAKERGYTIKEVSGLSRKSTAQTKVSPELLDIIFESDKPFKAPNKYSYDDGAFQVAQINSIAPPAEKEVDKQLKDQSIQKAKSNGLLIFTSIINKMKAQSERDVNPAILADHTM